MENFFEGLKKYLDTTPRDQVLEAWARTADQEDIVILTESNINLAVKHKYKSLPTIGLGKDFSQVQLNEPIIVYPQDIESHESMIMWGYSKAQLELRAYKLNAVINTMVIDNNNHKAWKMWLSKKQ